MVALRFNENWCMSGYHSVSVIADAIIKKLYRRCKAALMACVATANKRNYEGIGDYIDKGYIIPRKNGTFCFQYIRICL